MYEWIDKNKDWVFSGFGIFVITSVVSVVSVVATAWIRRRAEKRKRKRLETTTFFNPFVLPKNYKGISNADLKVSYKGASYDNLCLYCVDLRNDGLVAIERQTTVIGVPKYTEIIESFEKTSSSLLRYEKQESSTEDSIEIVFTFNRLEVGDMASLCFIFNFPSDIEKPTCSLRGVDNIDYMFRGADYRPQLDTDIEQALVLLAGIVLVDFIPGIGGLLQAAIIVLGVPIFTRIISKVVNRNATQSITNVTHIEGDVDAGSDGKVIITSGGASEIRT
jgi:hypothetical protein